VTSRRTGNRIVIHLGDCVEVMRGLEPASVHAVIVDPPYALGMMGKAWDVFGGDAKKFPQGSVEKDLGGSPYQKWNMEWLAECYRVMMPGAALLAFGGTRTYHRLVCAAEDVGFEVKNTLLWLYGAGFPKAQDLGALIDKRGGVDISWFGAWLREERKRRGITQKELAKHFPSKTGGLTGCVANWELGYNLPTVDEFNTLCAVMDLPFATLEEAEREVVGRGKAGIAVPGERRRHTVGGSRSVEIPITAPATDLAREWDGWKVGGLKPAYEPILLARKPCEGSITANVLKYGVGAFNADACRVETGDSWSRGATGSSPAGLYELGRERIEQSGDGRFPPNLLLDEYAAAMVDEQSGVEKGGFVRNRTDGARVFDNKGKPTGYETTDVIDEPDAGASRFFPRFKYTAKATRWEREAGLDRRHAIIKGSNFGNNGARPHTQPDYHYEAEARNPHPTIKPIRLMRWLIELVTREGQIILDPLCGSGTTCAAARWLGREAIGIEKEPEYHAIAVAREEWWAKQRGKEYDAVKLQWEAESRDTPLFEVTE